MSSKALAGPKYVVNVRFNQPGYKRHTDDQPHANPELFHIKPHEVLVREKKVHRKNRDRITGVQSWCQRNPVAFNKLYTFAGVAETGQDAAHRHSMQQGLAMCVSGVVKAFNESGALIKVGDLLTFGPNQGRVSQDGVPRKKQRVTFIKYDKNNPNHRIRGIVARAESGARNLETFDAHVFAHTQFADGNKPTVADIYTLSVPHVLDQDDVDAIKVFWSQAYDTPGPGPAGVAVTAMQRRQYILAFLDAALVAVPGDLENAMNGFAFGAPPAPPGAAAVNEFHNRVKAVHGARGLDFVRAHLN